MKLSIVLILIIGCRSLIAQNVPEYDNDYHQSIKCTLGTRYSVTQRKDLFPFNRAEKILLIAYKNYDELLSRKYILDSSINSEGRKIKKWKQVHHDMCGEKEVIKKWEINNLEQFKMKKYCAVEMIEVTQNQIDTLSNILFNYNLDKPAYEIEKPHCYTPRNAVLFLNEKEQVIAVVEICFECSQMYFSFDKNEGLLDCYCYARNKALKDFFHQRGIKYGIDSR